MSLPKELQKKAKTIEQIIHSSDPSLELCNLNCENICGATNECPFRDVKHILELDDVLAILEGENK